MKLSRLMESQNKRIFIVTLNILFDNNSLHLMHKSKFKLWNCNQTFTLMNLFIRQFRQLIVVYDAICGIK